MMIQRNTYDVLWSEKLPLFMEKVPNAFYKLNFFCLHTAYISQYVHQGGSLATILHCYFSNRACLGHRLHSFPRPCLENCGGGLTTKGESYPIIRPVLLLILYLNVLLPELLSALVLLPTELMMSSMCYEYHFTTIITLCLLL
ncbi:hypothetical protein TNCV_1259541 [Trichonephila clavipes]|nr:hypothetical protein TNCV_1259541 [Trichonephila clavipes]